MLKHSTEKTFCNILPIDVLIGYFQKYTFKKSCNVSVVLLWQTVGESFVSKGISTVNICCTNIIFKNNPTMNDNVRIKQPQMVPTNDKRFSLFLKALIFNTRGPIMSSVCKSLLKNSLTPDASYTSFLSFFELTRGSGKKINV